MALTFGTMESMHKLNCFGTW